MLTVIDLCGTEKYNSSSHIKDSPEVRRMREEECIVINRE